MRKLLLVISFFSAVLCKAQNIAPITETEYNYITKGIKIQEESGLDTKKGYLITELFTFPQNSTTQTRTTTFKAISRENEKKPFAYLCIYKNSANGFIDYICFPIVDPQGVYTAKANSILTEYDENGKIAIIWGLLHLSMHNLN